MTTLVPFCVRTAALGTARTPGISLVRTSAWAVMPALEARVALRQDDSHIVADHAGDRGRRRRHREHRSGQLEVGHGVEREAHLLARRDRGGVGLGVGHHHLELVDVVEHEELRAPRPGRAGGRLRGGRARDPVRAGQGGVGARARAPRCPSSAATNSPTVPFTAETVASTGARSVVSSRSRCAWSTAAWAAVTCPACAEMLDGRSEAAESSAFCALTTRLLGVGDGEPPARLGDVLLLLRRVEVVLRGDDAALGRGDGGLGAGAGRGRRAGGGHRRHAGRVAGRRRRRAAGREHRHGGAARARRLLGVLRLVELLLGLAERAAGVVDGRLGGVVLRVGLGLRLLPGSSGPGRGCPASPRRPASCSASRAWPAGCAAARGPGRGPAAPRTGRWWRAPVPP